MTGLEWFLTVKAGLAGLTVVLLVVHMWTERWQVGTFDRMLRYVALLACACAFAYGAVDQLQDPDFHVQRRNLIGFGALLLVFAATVASIAHTWNTHQRRR